MSTRDEGLTLLIAAVRDTAQWTNRGEKKVQKGIKGIQHLCELIQADW